METIVVLSPHVSDQPHRFGVMTVTCHRMYDQSLQGQQVHKSISLVGGLWIQPFS